MGSSGRGWWRYAYKCSACLHWSQAQLHTKAALCWVWCRCWCWCHLLVPEVKLTKVGTEYKQRDNEPPGQHLHTTTIATLLPYSYHHQLHCFHLHTNISYTATIFYCLSSYNFHIQVQERQCSAPHFHTTHCMPCTQISTPGLVQAAGCRTCRPQLWRVSTPDQSINRVSTHYLHTI